MSHGYRIDVDGPLFVIYTKTHNNGEKTDVKIERVGFEKSDRDWVVTVHDPNGSKKLGRFDTKKEARRRATRWMRNHPKGIQSKGGLEALDKAESVTESIFTGGGRFL